MYSKRLMSAIFVLSLASCSTWLPWHDEPIGQEVNVVLELRNNLLYIPSATINAHAGQFLFGTAQPRTVIDQRLAAVTRPSFGGGYSLRISEKEALRFRPLTADLRGVGDAIIGADVWGNHAVTIDYTTRLLTFQREGIHPELMTLYRFDGAPAVRVNVDGVDVDSIVDTTSPDTLVLPRGNAPAGRKTAHISLAGSDLGNVDIRLGDVSAPRIGNRLLSHFLVTVDYGRREVGLWRDPRIAP
jgi:hypothetical protein